MGKNFNALVNVVYRDPNECMSDCVSNALWKGRSHICVSMCTECVDACASASMGEGISKYKSESSGRGHLLETAFAELEKDRGR